jgi:hypothetical protein
MLKMDAFKLFKSLGYFLKRVEKSPVERYAAF